jgi:tetratricopeptide (TPR) repeat protein
VVEVPLDLGRLHAAAATIAHAVEIALDIDPAVPARTDRSPALELLLRARHTATQGSAHLARAIELFTEAAALAPDEPRIAAGLAMARVRQVFFTLAPSQGVMDGAVALAHAALAAAPDLAEAHLAVGHVELHTGEAMLAARHFRAAIALDPYDADSHLWLGRMLLEAGFLAPGIARIEEALAIAPRLEVARWEIVRAHALEQRWDEVERLIADLLRSPIASSANERVASLARIAGWRRQPEALRAVRAQLSQLDNELITPGAARALAEVYLDGDWPRHRDMVMAYARTPTPDRRRRTFLSQLAADAAGGAGDHAACLEMLDEAVAFGLFDLHWLERSPLLAGVRDAPAYAPIHATTKRRADAILDAFYGDHAVHATAETTLATAIPLG